MKRFMIISTDSLVVDFKFKRVKWLRPIEFFSNSSSSFSSMDPIRNSTTDHVRCPSVARSVCRPVMLCSLPRSSTLPLDINGAGNCYYGLQCTQSSYLSLCTAVHDAGLVLSVVRYGPTEATCPASQPASFRMLMIMTWRSFPAAVHRHNTDILCTATTATRNSVRGGDRPWGSRL